MEDVQEIFSSKFQGQHDKVYALQLKQKSIAGVFHGILGNLRAATFENIF